MPQFPAAGAAGVAPASREISEVGPSVGSTSFTVGTGLVFVSADGTWGHPTG